MRCLRGNHEELPEYYDIAIGPNPEFAFAYYEKEFSLMNLERYNETEECLQKAIEINSECEPLAEDLRGHYIS